MSTSSTMRAPVRTEPTAEEIEEAAQVFEAEVALTKNRLSNGDEAWERAFEFALDMGNSAKSAAIYASVNADAFLTTKDSPKVPAATAKRKRQNAVEQLAEARLAGAQSSSD